MSKSNFHKLSGLFGIIAAILGLSAVVVSTFLCGVGCGEGVESFFEFADDGSFSWSSNALSDLGVSEVADIFNYPLIIVGILNFVFAVGFVKVYSNGILFRIGGLVLILGGGSLSLVGIITEAYGILHNYVSWGYFGLFPIGVILVGLALIREKEVAGGVASIFAGALALIVILVGLVLLYSLGYEEYPLHYGGFAIPEFIEALILGGWVLWMGASLMRLQISDLS